MPVKYWYFLKKHFKYVQFKYKNYLLTIQTVVGTFWLIHLKNANYIVYH